MDGNDSQNTRTTKANLQGISKAKKETQSPGTVGDELLSLAESGEIKHTENKIKKASPAEQERIMVKYKQEPLE